MLFILAVDTLALLSVSSIAMIRMFADDIIYYRAIFRDLDLLAVQADVHMIANWTREVGVRLNTGKTKVVQEEAATISLPRSGWCPDPAGEHLGFTLSSDLTWSEHIFGVCTRARRLIGLLYRQLGGANRACLSYLYKA